MVRDAGSGAWKHHGHARGAKCELNNQYMYSLRAASLHIHMSDACSVMELQGGHARSTTCAGLACPRGQLFFLLSAVFGNHHKPHSAT